MRKIRKRLTAFLCVLTMASSPTLAAFAQSESKADQTDIVYNAAEDCYEADIARSEQMEPEEEETAGTVNKEPEAAEEEESVGTVNEEPEAEETVGTVNEEPEATEEEETVRTVTEESEQVQEAQKKNESKIRLQEIETAADDPAQSNPSSQTDNNQTSQAFSKEITFTIEKTTYSYTGNGVQPAVSNVTVTINGSPVSLTADQYSAVYDDNINIGSNAKVILYGKGPYKGYFGSADFTITAADLEKDCKLSLKKTSLAYTGKALKPAAVVTFRGNTLKKGTDYTVTYYNNTKVGTATAVVKGKGNFQGEVTMYFSIQKAAQKLTASAKPASVKIGKTSRVTVKGNKGKLSYKSSKPSVASVNKKGIVKGLKKGTATITIKAAATSKYKEGTAKIKIKVEGNELTRSNTKVQLSTSSYTYDGKSKTPAVKKVTWKGKTLKKNRDYKVSYEDNKNAGKAKVVIKGIKKYSGTIKVAFRISQADNSLAASINKSVIDIKRTAYIEVSKAHGDISFTSSNKAIASVAKNGVITGKKKGRCTITVIASGDQNHKRAAKQFHIVVGVRNLSDSVCSIALSDNSYVYDGSYKKPAVSIQYDGEKLTQNKDYTLSYSNNRNAGEAKVYIKGKGKYEGSRTLTFTINKAEQKNFSISLKNNHIPLGGKAKVSITGAKGELSYGSYSPSYAKPLGNGWFQGLIKTQNYVTITVTAKGDENYKAKTIEMRVQIY